jgi:heme oxygenase
VQPVRAKIRDRLRVATASVHEALHGAPPFARIAQGKMDRPGYGALLQKLHRYHAAMEVACTQGAAVLDMPQLGAAQAARIQALCDDMTFLGVMPLTAQNEAPVAPAFVVGCLYTVLGSTLGGKVIHGQLDNLLTDARGREFFKGAPDSGAQWRQFCTALEIYGTDDRTKAIEAGALQAFARFGAMLD